MEHAVEFGMLLMLFASVTVAFAAGLLEFIWKDTIDYDMEYLWNHRYTLEDLHLDRKE
ncbi:MULTISPECIES: hypothetical protein [Paenibacillus]|uniref:hypothetical protein n=1 Tax=Paenibacillus TaxID=44249 RepID=UPI0022B93E9D|nr:hypothetical protein [Paenibacillus caseinilyticus]MCZ8518128.1 hypothetical protein [Paenibacillus caseinilyticus]